MNTGKVVGIFISSKATALPHFVESALAVAQLGLEGDRYYYKQGTFSNAEPRTGRELTLVEAEALMQLQQDYGVVLTAEEARRNIVTEQVNLNQLVGKQFLVGEVLVEGIRSCPPCAHLEKITGKKLLTGLQNMGGLRAHILSTGVIQVGAEIRLDLAASDLETMGEARSETIAPTQEA